MHFRFTAREQATAIILAGGKSTRMEKDKSLLEIDGQPLIAHIYNQLQPCFEEIIIGADDYAKFVFLPARVVPDIIPGQGPLVGIWSCLEASQNEINFILACDIPELNLPFIKQMLELVSGCDIVIPRHANGHYEPLFAVYKKSVIAPLARLIKRGKRKISDLFTLVNTRFIDLEPGMRLINLNSKVEYLSYRETSRKPIHIREF